MQMSHAAVVLKSGWLKWLIEARSGGCHVILSRKGIRARRENPSSQVSLSEPTSAGIPLWLENPERNVVENVRHRPQSPLDDNRPRPASGPHNTAKMVAAKKHIPIVKKHKKRFNRHQSDRFKCVDPSWRKPKGIDSRVRRRFSGQAAMPKIGYGSNKKTRHMTPSGHKVFLVQNPKDVELLLMHNRTYAAEIGHAVSSGKRIDIIAKAKALGVKVTNAKGRLTTES